MTKKMQGQTRDIKEVLISEIAEQSKQRWLNEKELDQGSVELKSGWNSYLGDISEIKRGKRDLQEIC